MGILGTALHLVGHQFDRIRQHPVGYSNYARRNRLGSDHIFCQGMIMKPSSSADFQEDPKVQSPDPIQIHLEPRVIQCLPHLQGQPPLAPLLRSNLSLPITRWCSHFFPRSSCGFGPIMLWSLRSVPTTQAGGLVRPVAPGGPLQHAR